jgi:hypothetical protein
MLNRREDGSFVRGARLCRVATSSCAADMGRVPRRRRRGPKGLRAARGGVPARLRALETVEKVLTDAAGQATA